MNIYAGSRACWRFLIGLTILMPAAAGSSLVQGATVQGATAQGSTTPAASAGVILIVQENAHMTQHASGPFEVKSAPQKPDSEVAQAANIGRFTIDKVFHGDLEAISKGEMLAAGDPKASAGYVAMERVTGTLKGRKGSFVLQHTGTMTRGTPALTITVVPDSGTDELKGLSGKMKIIIAPDGKHSYEFEYSIE